MKKNWLVFTLLFFTYNSIACSCFYEPLSVKKILQYDLVIEGKIVGKDKVKDLNTTYGSERIIEYHKFYIQVKDFIKGNEESKSYEIYSNVESSACGVNYDIGDHLYIFAYKYKGSFHTGICSFNLRKKEATRKQKKIFCDYRKTKKFKDWKDDESKLIATGLVVDKKAEKKWTFFNQDSSVESYGLYVDGLKDGEWKYYYDGKSSKEYFKELTKEKKSNLTNSSNLLYKTEYFIRGERVKVVSHLE